MKQLIHVIQCSGERLWWIGVLTLLWLTGGFVWAIGQMISGAIEDVTVRDWILTLALVPMVILFCLILISGRVRMALGHTTRSTTCNADQVGWSYISNSAFGFVWLCNLLGPVWVVVIGYYVVSFFARMVSV